VEPLQQVVRIGLGPASLACICGKRSKHFIDDMMNVVLLFFWWTFLELYVSQKRLSPCLLWSFWQRFLSLATLAMNTNGEGMWIGLCLWATSGIPLRHTQVRVHLRQSLAPCCENRTSYFRRSCSYGIRILIYTCTSRESIKRFHAICCKARLSVKTVQKTIFWTRCVQAQARNQLGSPEERFWEMTTFF